jgi:predicted RNase H-like HicB family nuclease
MRRQLTAMIAREDDGYVALCPELDIAGQGDTVEATRDNLREALEFFFGAAPPEETDGRSPGVSALRGRPRATCFIWRTQHTIRVSRVTIRASHSMETPPGRHRAQRGGLARRNDGTDSRPWRIAIGTGA